MSYNPMRHKAFADYLDAVERSLRKSGASNKVIDGIRHNLILRFDEALANDAALNCDAYVAGLDDPMIFSSEFVRALTLSAFQRNAVMSASRPRIPLMMYVAGFFALVMVFSICAALYLIGIRNTLIGSRQAVDFAQARVEAVLQRRYDLIPNLVSTVKGFSTHESELLERVTELRSQWAASKSPEEKQGLRTEMERRLIHIMALSENYPALASSQHFLALQDQLEGTENRISVERQRYSQALAAYNTQCLTFPGSLFHFEVNKDYFKADEAAQKAPKVEL